jgi:hypothetical protein
MTDIQRDHLGQLSVDLHKYAAYDDTEVGEACMNLIQVSHYTDYMSEEFVLALISEMESQLENFEQYTSIVETEEILTRKIIRIEWE